MNLNTGAQLPTAAVPCDLGQVIHPLPVPFPQLSEGRVMESRLSLKRLL